MQKEIPVPRKVEVKGIRVLTSKQLAEEYGASPQKIKQNFANNRSRFVEGRHYISFTGDELRSFKNQVENFDLVDGRTSHLYLWTEKGALLHAKSLNTDKAWEVYDYLVDFYFRAKEEPKPVPVETAPVVSRKDDKKLPQIDDPIRALKLLLQVAEDNGIGVSSYPFKTFESVLKNGNIGIRTGVTVEKACYELAWELSHAFIHYRNGDMIRSPLSKDYNEQATRSAELILKILNVKMSQM